MGYNPKEVAELIANRKQEELEEALQPRLRKIAEIVYCLDIGNAIRQFFADYVSFGAYDAKVPFRVYSHDEGIDVFYCSEDMHLRDSTIVPFEFATCEDKDLKEVVITQLRDDLYQYVNKLAQEFNKARKIRDKFTIEYARFINTKE